MTAREEILAAMRALESRHGRSEFKLEEIVHEVIARGSSHKESTIRTHVAAHMCVDAPTNAATVYRDLGRTSRGHYRRLGA